MAELYSEEYLNRVSQDLNRGDEEKILRRASRKNMRSAAAYDGLTGRIGLLLDMLRDRKFKLQWSSRAIILAGLFYFIVPADTIPDIIPFVGYIDDAAVIGVVFRQLRGEIDRYRLFLLESE